jgi:hypothetical protein
VERAEACHHWGGEEPYDAERARQVGAAAARLRCETLGRDAIALKAAGPPPGRR